MIQFASMTYRLNKHIQTKPYKSIVCSYTHIHILIVFALAWYVRFRQLGEISPIFDEAGARDSDDVYSNNSVNRAEKGGIARREPCKCNWGGFCFVCRWRFSEQIEQTQPNPTHMTRTKCVSARGRGRARKKINGGRERKKVQPRNLFAGLASVLNWHMFVYTGLSRMMIFGFIQFENSNQNNCYVIPEKSTHNFQIG